MAGRLHGETAAADTFVKRRRAGPTPVPSVSLPYSPGRSGGVRGVTRSGMGAEEFEERYAWTQRVRLLALPQLP